MKLFTKKQGTMTELGGGGLTTTKIVANGGLIQKGTFIQSTPLAGQAEAYFNITFPTPFATPPSVMLECVFDSSIGQNLSWQDIQACVQNVTTTGFGARLANVLESSTASGPTKWQWTAIAGAMFEPPKDNLVSPDLSTLESKIGYLLMVVRGQRIEMAFAE